MIALGDLPKGNRRHPVVWGVALGFTLTVLAAGTGCENTGDDDAFDQIDGSLQGELVMYIADDHDRGTSVDFVRHPVRDGPGTAARVRPRSRPRAGRADQGVGAPLGHRHQPDAGDIAQTARVACRGPDDHVRAEERDEVAGEAAGVRHRRHRRRNEHHRRERAEGDRRSVDEHRSAAPELLRRGVVRHRGAGRSGVRPVPVSTSATATRLRAACQTCSGRWSIRWAAARSTTTSGTSDRDTIGVRLERPGRGGHARPARQRHLVQRLVELRGHGAGARAQLRHAALVVDGLRIVGLRRRAQRHLHAQRVRRSLRPDGRRLPPHERLAEDVQRLDAGLQHGPGSVERHVHAAAARAGLRRRPGRCRSRCPRRACSCARAAADRRPTTRSRTTTSSCARSAAST